MQVANIDDENLNVVATAEFAFTCRYQQDYERLKLLDATSRDRTNTARGLRKERVLIHHRAERLRSSHSRMLVDGPEPARIHCR